MRTLTWKNIEIRDIHNPADTQGDRLCVENLASDPSACGHLAATKKWIPTALS